MNSKSSEEEKPDLPIRVVHLSDIHLGRDKTTPGRWNCTRQFVINDHPDFILVSGDSVDNPSPLSLLLAWLEIRKLAEDAHAGLLVIPGNHDVAFRGSFQFWPFTRLFDRIFTERCYQYFGKRAPTYSTFRDKHWLKRFFWRIWLYFRLLIKLPCLRPERKRNALWRPFDKPGDNHRVSKHVHIVGMDSNRSFFLASGKVADEQLDELNIATHQHEHEDSGVRVLVPRVLVIHHHPVPIPYCGENLSSYEPFLVLREAGTVLSQAALNDFDLILHGHRHVRNFSYLSYIVRNRSQRSLAVLGAASPTAEDIESTTRSYNFIEIHRNGRILVRERFTSLGHSLAAAEGENDFIEAIPLIDIKRRTFDRARRIQRISCKSFVRDVAITEFGTTNQKMKFRDILAQSDSWPFEFTISLSVFLGFLDPAGICLDKTFSTKGVAFNASELSTRAGAKEAHTSDVDMTFTLPTAAATNVGATFRTVNNFQVSQWECHERQGSGEEFVSMRVRFPTRFLAIDLELPDSHRDVTPYLHCRRVRGFPLVELEPLSRLVKFPPDYSDLVYDPDLTQMEAPGLTKTGERHWRFEVEYPLVGYAYEVRWRVGDMRETDQDLHIKGQTMVVWAAAARRREQLLRTDIKDIPSPDTFLLLLKALLVEFQDRFKANDLTHETARLCYLTYQRKSDTASEPRVMGVQEVVDGPNSEPIPLEDYWMPLGEGAAGLTFKTGNPTLICEWAANAMRGHGSPLFSWASKLTIQGVLALPVYHRLAWERLQAERKREQAFKISDVPSPAEIIGVITYASDSPGTGLAKLYDDRSDGGVGADTFLEILDVVQNAAPAIESALLA